MWEARKRFSEPGSQRIEEMAEEEMMFYGRSKSCVLLVG